MIEKSFRLSPTIVDSTKGAKSILELGAGIFRMFDLYPEDAHCVGIELVQSYIDKRVNKREAVAIQGSALDFEKLLDDNGETEKFDIIMLIDFIEHLDKDDSIDLIVRAKKRAKAIFVFTPLEDHPQHGGEAYGFANPKIKRHIDAVGQRDLAIEAQRHKSTWYVKDLEELGFQTIWVNNRFHPGPHSGAIWAEWHEEA